MSNDQKKAVQETEALQDFRREREGHMLVRDGRPLLILSFGQKRMGSKFRADGKYAIPVGFKSIAKWEQDEICFMTRESTSDPKSLKSGSPSKDSNKSNTYPEFQIIYLPRSSSAEDFAVIEWSSNVKEVWARLLDLIGEKDLNSFSKGPWYFFGVFDDAVQAALDRPSTKHEDIEGILYCAGSTPTLEELKKYLNFEPSDVPYLWIVEEFQKEQLPSNYFQYTSQGMAYWVDANTQTSTWKHPLFDKYSKMLLAARTHRPLPSSKEIMCFQIECLYTRGSENLSTIDYLFDLARIFKADLKKEPYMMHLMVRAYKHYSEIIKMKRAVSDVNDFVKIMNRYRKLVSEFESAKKNEQSQTESVMLCVECSSEKKEATMYCDTCQDLMCETCFERLHSRGRRKTHKRTFVELGLCTECDSSLARLQCMQCQDMYCGECFLTIHQRGGRRNHIPICLRVFNEALHKLPATEVFAFGGIAPAAVHLGKSASKMLERAMSPWFKLQELNELPVYRNLQTGEVRRDAPLAVLNEPIDAHSELVN